MMWRDSKDRVAGYAAASTDCGRLLEARGGGRGRAGALGGSEHVGGGRRLVIERTKRGAADDLELIEVE